MTSRFVAILHPILCLISVCCAFTAAPALAQVVWEDYQGTIGILGSSGNDKAGPSFNNTVSPISGLRAISATTSNATRTGTSTTIDFRTAGDAVNNATLCNSTHTAANTGYDATGLQPSCLADAQGRVLYALIKFPYTGSYNFSLAHDDDVDLDLSTDYSNTSFRSASYNIPVGDAASYTADENTYESLAGIFSSPTANACILMRLYWTNYNGLNHLRLRWTRPNATGSGTTTEIVPAAYLFDPGNPASSSGCTGTVATTNTSIVANKVIGGPGRASSADQFTVAIRNSGGTVQVAATTGGTGTGQQASTGGWIAAASTTYQINDAMAAGSTNTLAAAYNATIACTKNGVAYTPGGSSPTWTVTTTANQPIICTITNTPKTATLRLSKTWVSAIINNAVSLPASTGFFSNTTAFASIANTANETDTSGDFTVYAGETGTLTAESFTTGSAANYNSALACSAGTLSGTNGQSANTLTIPVSAIGTTITCTFTNTYRPQIGFTKVSSAYSDPLHGVSSTTAIMIPGGVVSYDLLVTTPSAYAVSSNSLFVADTVPSGMKLFVGDIGVVGSGPIQFIQGAPSSTLTYSFVSHASTADDLEYSSDGGTTWTYVPTVSTIGADGADGAITNIRVNPKGTMPASTSFTIRLRMVIR